jgi:hypothetical protein
MRAIVRQRQPAATVSMLKCRDLPVVAFKTAGTGSAHPERVQWSRLACADDVAVIEEAVSPGSAASERNDERQWGSTSASVPPGTLTGRKSRLSEPTKHGSASSVAEPAEL